MATHRAAAERWGPSASRPPPSPRQPHQWVNAPPMQQQAAPVIQQQTYISQQGQRPPPPMIMIQQDQPHTSSRPSLATPTSNDKSTVWKGDTVLERLGMWPKSSFAHRGSRKGPHVSRPASPEMGHTGSGPQAGAEASYQASKQGAAEPGSEPLMTRARTHGAQLQHQAPGTAPGSWPAHWPEHWSMPRQQGPWIS
eukprot:TRINITY_DN30429_c0_g3_i1.p1 TRINITY_DN30429_c0_g3~~TRINITY_DN30429_c0_g3_i1.p1  ORF type:complete len:196 (-),score=18.61 TRINITY_DN30429_c0_g3_i1:132-719(-)